ncbi:MAG: ribonuclease H-like domain-containing protein, partial [Candidatus Omnitrophica bacterium]|nr:ribonuclease H-like domain-containing protein [Candidatus Omnitrophota bacterium]
QFWQTIRRYDQFITFNGRSFDCPYIMIRSAIHKIKPTRNLMPYRYDSKEHIDLLDLFTFYGAVRKRFSLHMWCRAFGIKSPKEEGITGDTVKDFFKEKKFLEIARYCLGDLYATKELYFYWDKYIKV